MDDMTSIHKRTLHVFYILVWDTKFQTCALKESSPVFLHIQSPLDRFGSILKTY